MDILSGILQLLVILFAVIVIVAPTGRREKIGRNPIRDDIDEDEYYKLLYKKII